MPGTPRTWTEDYPELPDPQSPKTPAQPPPSTADKVVAQIISLILEVLRDHGELLARFNAGLVPIRQELRNA